MAKRKNIGGTYMQVRQKNTSKGKKGTFMKKWKSSGGRPKKDKSKPNNLSIIIIIILILMILGLIYYFLI